MYYVYDGYLFIVWGNINYFLLEVVFEIVEKR